MSPAQRVDRILSEAGAQEEMLTTNSNGRRSRLTGLVRRLEEAWK